MRESGTRAWKQAPGKGQYFTQITEDFEGWLGWAPPDVAHRGVPQSGAMGQRVG